MNWGILFVALLGIALATLWLARRSKAATGLPDGRLVYADTTRWRPVERPLFSPSQLLTGRPDYLIQRRREVIPVEVKSGAGPSGGPHPSHILQLAAYCLLVEEAYRRRPSHGVILYADDVEQAYEVEYTAELEGRLILLLDEMREALADGDAPRDHDQISRCQACGYRRACNQSLV